MTPSSLNPSFLEYLFEGQIPWQHLLCFLTFYLILFSFLVEKHISDDLNNRGGTYAFPMLMYRENSLNLARNL